MDKKALQEQFEAIAVQNCWNINKYPAGWDGHGDDEYVDEFVNGAWWGFQHQQAKVEELEHDKEFAENSAQEWTAKAIEERNAKLELQKRVDAALETIAKLKQDTTERDTYLELEELEQALKGEDK